VRRLGSGPLRSYLPGTPIWCGRTRLPWNAVAFDRWAHASFMTEENKQRVLHTVADYRHGHGDDFPPMSSLMRHTELSWTTIRILRGRLVEEGRLQSFPDEARPTEP
jgi:hypothetical protein